MFGSVCFHSAFCLSDTLIKLAVSSHLTPAGTLPGGHQEHHEEKPGQIAEPAREGDKDPAGAECAQAQECGEAASLHREGPERVSGHGGKSCGMIILSLFSKREECVTPMLPEKLITNQELRPWAPVQCLDKVLEP